MKPQIVKVPSIKVPLVASPGFAKKAISDYKLDVIGLCQFGCLYCSSNAGNYLRTNRAKFADATEQQWGVRSFPSDNPQLMFEWPDITDRLTKQLNKARPGFGQGMTVVYSMLTDGFSPHLVNTGVTEEVLQMVLEKTQFRIRVLTKNSIVGMPKWLEFFVRHPDRFVVGLSTGSLDDVWARKVELMTSPPSSRLNALSELQAAGIPTYGMLCPIFPDVLEGNRLEELVERVNPQKVEHVWAEPFNDRANWSKVRGGYEEGSAGYEWLTEVYSGEGKGKKMWSKYATDLYVRLRTIARRDGWLHKLRYLLYEGDITETDAEQFRGFEGVLLQSRPHDDGKSQNKFLAALQST